MKELSERQQRDAITDYRRLIAAGVCNLDWDYGRLNYAIDAFSNILKFDFASVIARDEPHNVA